MQTEISEERQRFCLSPSSGFGKAVFVFLDLIASFDVASTRKRTVIIAQIKRKILKKIKFCVYIGFGRNIK